jgi:hypothetical protein
LVDDLGDDVTNWIRSLVVAVLVPLVREDRVNDDHRDRYRCDGPVATRRRLLDIRGHASGW